MAMKRNKRQWGLPLVWGTIVIALLCFGFPPFAFAQNPEKAPLRRILTEEEIAREKLYSALAATLAQKFFDYRKRPVIRIAVFDFTDPDGNVVKGGRELADKIMMRLYGQSQFEVVSREKTKKYLGWNGLTTLGKLDAQGLQRLQHRINTMDPDNGIHCLLLGEVKRGAGRSLHVSASIVNFQFKIGTNELEKNILDTLALEGEIPLPTEQALHAASEVIVRKESRPWNEGRLLILVNTRGHLIWETDYVKLINKETPYSWDKIPYVFLIGKEETSTPERIKIGMEGLTLLPISPKKNSPEELKYLFLHGKFATNEVFFDDRLPVQNYRIATSFLDSKTNETYSELTEIAILSDTTTYLIVGFFVPGEKERIRGRQYPKIQFHQLFGKGTEVLPDR